MIRIYHAPRSRSVRPIWLCYELGLEIEVVPIDFSQAYRDTPEWRAISPAGKVPAMTDGDLTMFESGAMLEHILDRYGEGRLRPPAGTNERALHQQWFWYAEATLSRPTGVFRLLSDQGGDIAAEAAEKTRDGVRVVDAELAGRDYLMGDDFTAADVMMGYTLGLLRRVNLVDAAAHPRAAAYLERLSGREAYLRAASV